MGWYPWIMRQCHEDGGQGQLRLSRLRESALIVSGFSMYVERTPFTRLSHSKTCKSALASWAYSNHLQSPDLKSDLFHARSCDRTLIPRRPPSRLEEAPYNRRSAAIGRAGCGNALHLHLISHLCIGPDWDLSRVLGSAYSQTISG